MKNQNGENKNYVLDSSAFLTFFEDEKRTSTVQKLLERAKKEEVIIFVCFATYTEIFRAVPLKNSCNINGLLKSA